MSSALTLPNLTLPQCSRVNDIPDSFSRGESIALNFIYIHTDFNSCEWWRNITLTSNITDTKGKMLATVCLPLCNVWRNTSYYMKTFTVNNKISIEILSWGSLLFPEMKKTRIWSWQYGDDRPICSSSVGRTMVPHVGRPERWSAHNRVPAPTFLTFLKSTTSKGHSSMQVNWKPPVWQQCWRHGVPGIAGISGGGRRLLTVFRNDVNTRHPSLAFAYRSLLKVSPLMNGSLWRLNCRRARPLGKCQAIEGSDSYWCQRTMETLAGVLDYTRNRNVISNEHNELGH